MLNENDCVFNSQPITEFIRNNFCQPYFIKLTKSCAIINMSVFGSN